MRVEQASTGRLRVAFVIPSFSAGGAERVLITFANNLPRERFQVALVMLDATGQLKDLVERDVRIIDLGVPRISRALPMLLRSLRRLRPDAVMVSAPHVIQPLLASRYALPRRTKLLIRPANLPSLSLQMSRFPRVFAFGYRHLYRHADLVFATSHRMRRELFGRGIPDGITVDLPNPVDVRRIRQLADPPTRVPGEGRRFVAVGRLVPQKGYDLLLPQMLQLPEGDHLTILGDGPERDRLNSMAAALGLDGRVQLLGFAENPWTWMAGADALVMPSRTEGMPNAALEALACGTPVIASEQAGGLRDLVRDSSIGSVHIVSPAAIGDALARLKPRTRWPRPSLLPPGFDLAEAVASLERQMEQIVDQSAG